MIYIEASSTLRLRPSHLLLMIYRYLSGVYQAGDLFALNYIKGFMDGKSASKPERILTVSGHGIGEAETWLAERMDDCRIDTVSFRMIDTQLLQFLRAAGRADIETIFSKFAEMVAPYPLLLELASDAGLVPYWCDQAQDIQRYFQRQKITVFSDHPLCIETSCHYDLIYVSHGMQYFSVDAAEKLRQHLSPEGWLAILMPPADGNANGDRFARFSSSMVARESKTLFRKLLESRGYALAPLPTGSPDLRNLAVRRELSRFNVLASAKSVLLGELILASLGEHISDRTRMEILNETAAQFNGLSMPVNEELELLIIEAKS
jgi:SAM-dependent methyltransferase